MMQQIQRSINIKAPPSTVWSYLTHPELISQWMGEPEMNLEIITDWKVGSPLLIRGFHHVEFENKGKILQEQINDRTKLRATFK